MRPVVHEIIESSARPWRVVCICDTAGDPGVACAVTVGLHTLGLPELFLAARPANLDPGHDWRLSHQDLAEVLGTLGDSLLNGDLWERDLLTALDTGVTAARLTPGFPTDLGELLGSARQHAPASEPLLHVLGALFSARFTGDPTDGFADGIPDAARTRITMVGWELVDGPRAVDAFIGSVSGHDPVPLAAELTQLRTRTTALRGQILERGGRPGRVPARWRPNPQRAPHPTAAPQRQRFGPRHPVVVARAEQLLLADVRLLKAFLARAWDLSEHTAHDTAGEVLGAVGVLAGTTGRDHVPAELEIAADDVTTLLTGRHGAEIRWQRAVVAQRHRVPPQHRADLERLARRRLRRHVHAALATEAFADALPRDTVSRGRLAWSEALEVCSRW